MMAMGSCILCNAAWSAAEIVIVCYESDAVFDVNVRESRRNDQVVLVRVLVCPMYGY